MPVTDAAVSTHTWRAISKYMLQMLITDARVESGLDWRVSLAGTRSRDAGFSFLGAGGVGWEHTAAAAAGSPAAPAGDWAAHPVSISAALLLRGATSGEADAAALGDPALCAPAAAARGGLGAHGSAGWRRRARVLAARACTGLRRGRRRPRC